MEQRRMTERDLVDVVSMKGMRRNPLSRTLTGPSETYFTFFWGRGCSL